MTEPSSQRRVLSPGGYQSVGLFKPLGDSAAESVLVRSEMVEYTHPTLRTPSLQSA
jgi:hypothetical protein